MTHKMPPELFDKFLELRTDIEKFRAGNLAILKQKMGGYTDTGTLIEGKQVGHSFHTMFSSIQNSETVIDCLNLIVGFDRNNYGQIEDEKLKPPDVRRIADLIAIAKTPDLFGHYMKDISERIQDFYDANKDEVDAYFLAATGQDLSQQVEKICTLEAANNVDRLSNHLRTLKLEVSDSNPLLYALSKAKEAISIKRRGV